MRKQFKLFYGQARRNPLHFSQMTQAQELETRLEELLLKIHQRNKKERLFGVVEWHYHDGAVVLVRKQQTFEQKDLLRLAAE